MRGGRRISAIVNGGVHRVHRRRFCNEEDKGALGDDEQGVRALDRDYIRSPRLVSWEKWSLGEEERAGERVGHYIFSDFEALACTAQA